MTEDFERCYRAVRSRDQRFDGWFFTAVTSTGVYCRPSCPAMTPDRRNVRFYATAAAAQHAGFRACKRCRPDATPGSPQWDTRADAVGRAMRLIADGALDRGGVADLASRLGYSSRQLERLMVASVGVGPVALARAQRAQAARVLIETTDLAMADVAFGAGFASIRQFNDTVRSVFAFSPTQMRRAVAGRPGAHAPGPAGGGPGQTVGLRLPFRSPLCPDNLFGHLAATAVPGVEEVREGAYRRTVRLAHGVAIVSLRPEEKHVWASVTLADLRDLGPCIARCRRLLDLDADPQAVAEVLAADEVLAPLVAAAPGRRVPRTMDEAEMALRAVLGQQISTAAARAHAGRLAAAWGTPVTDAGGGLNRTFPSPATVCERAGNEQDEPGRVLRVPRSRRDSLVALAGALADGSLVLGPGADWQEARAALRRLPGIGPWTAEVVAMRALGDPDAFPIGDAGLQRGAVLAGAPGGEVRLAQHARAWRPWRSYATQYLWSTLDHPTNRFPTARPPDRLSARPTGAATAPERKRHIERAVRHEPR